MVKSVYCLAYKLLTNGTLNKVGMTWLYKHWSMTRIVKWLHLVMHMQVASVRYWVSVCKNDMDNGSSSSTNAPLHNSQALVRHMVHQYRPARAAQFDMDFAGA